jgi:hypothetical protein
MQLQEKYKENFDKAFGKVSSRRSKGLRSKRRGSPCIFQVVATYQSKRFLYSNKISNKN